MKRVILAVGLVVSCAGCFGKGRVDPSDRGYVNLEADEKGMQAFNDMIQGAITNGKASADQKSASWQHREVQEKERSLRETNPSWLQMLAGGGARNGKN